jgi:hypothetical protein
MDPTRSGGGGGGGGGGASTLTLVVVWQERRKVINLGGGGLDILPMFWLKFRPTSQMSDSIKFMMEKLNA